MEIRNSRRKFYLGRENSVRFAATAPSGLTLAAISETNRTIMSKVIDWAKKPENIILILLLSVATICGILDNKLEVLFVIYLIAFSIGLLLRLIYYLKDKYLK